MKRRAPLRRQRGVAVITALLLTTLAITIVASLFWQQQVQVRSIENQRLQLQKQWILRGALDWTRLILREDARYSTIDHLGEPWAVSLAETRLDQYVENGKADADIPDAAISGGIVDAQARFNLSNLVVNGSIRAAEVALFGRLLSNLQLNPSLAQATAGMMVAAQKEGMESGTGADKTGQTGDQTGGASKVASAGTQKTLQIAYVDDLLAVPGFTPEAVAKLKDFVIVLPDTAQINLNTAPAEVLASAVGTLSVSAVAALIAGREKLPYNTREDFMKLLPGPDRDRLGGSGQFGVSTNYFLINGNVRLNRAALEMQALIKRTSLNGRWITEVIWIREN
jgi:general secretion pathway protein K